MASGKHTARLIGLALSLSFVLPRVAPRTGLAEASCTESNFDPSALRGDAAEGDWLTYRTAKDGLSFRYPRSMQVEDRDPTGFGYDKAHDPEVVVDLQAHGSIIMRFICEPGERTPEMAATMLRRIRQQASEKDSALTTMQIDSHGAILGGPKRGPWSIALLQPRACDVFPMDPPDDDRRPPPHDGQYPLLSIIETVHFEPVQRKR